PLDDCLAEPEIDTGSYGARHSMPSQCHITAPRQYIEPGGAAVLSGNSARKAMSEEFTSAAMLPGDNRTENPVPAEPIARKSNRKPVLVRGNKTNKRAKSGDA